MNTVKLKTTLETDNRLMNKTDQQPDRNFDDLAPKFQRKVYGNLKGRIRLAILKHDLKEFYPASLVKNSKKPLRILDAGSGYGPFSLYLAQLGHHVTLCDHSKNMLAIARKKIGEQDLQNQTTLIHSSVQNLIPPKDGLYDMVLCHAVLEWVNDPEKMIALLLQHLKVGGILSLTFYNQNGMIYKNLLRANYKKILKKEYAGWPGSLTPTHPLKSDQVIGWLNQYPLQLLCHSGMRVFHDYILNLEDKQKDPDTVIQLEVKFSRIQPYRDLGRYQHLLLQRKYNT